MTCSRDLSFQLPGGFQAAGRHLATLEGVHGLSALTRLTMYYANSVRDLTDGRGHGFEGLTSLRHLDVSQCGSLRMLNGVRELRRRGC